MLGGPLRKAEQKLEMAGVTAGSTAAESALLIVFVRCVKGLPWFQHAEIDAKLRIRRWAQAQASRQQANSSRIHNYSHDHGHCQCSR